MSGEKIFCSKLIMKRKDVVKCGKRLADVFNYFKILLRLVTNVLI